MCIILFKIIKTILKDEIYSGGMLRRLRTRFNLLSEVEMVGMLRRLRTRFNLLLEVEN